MKKSTEKEETQRQLNILKKAKDGDECAQYLMGKSCEEKEDYAAAFEWYVKSAGLNSIDELEQYYKTVTGESSEEEEDFDEEYAYSPGYCEGMYSLGNLFFYGKGVEQDYTKAVMCYSLCGGEDSSYDPNLVDAYENDDEPSCDYEYHEGTLMLGICYFEGLGVKQDCELGFRIMMGAEEEVNDPRRAWRNIGIAFLEGKGTEQDEKNAIKWFEYAAESEDGSDAISQYYLGLCYENGRGVDKDATAAKEWFEKAAAQGYEGAKLKLAGNNE